MSVRVRQGPRSRGRALRRRPGHGRDPRLRATPAPRRIRHSFRIYPARFLEGDTWTTCAVHLQDASAEGLCLHSDRPFPEGLFPLVLLLEEPWEGQAEVMRRREFVPGIHAIGPRFRLRERRMPDLLKRYCHGGRRSHPRLETQMAVEILDGRNNVVLSTFTWTTCRGA